MPLIVPIERRRRSGLPAAPRRSAPQAGDGVRALGLSLVTGAADDDPSAIGTYASAGAALGPGILWTAPVLFPMMVAAVYLSSKLGRVTGQGLASIIRSHYARWILAGVTVAVVVGNTVEAAADLGGMGAALHLLLPVPEAWLVVGMGLTIIGFQLWGSYGVLRSIFRWLALALLAYIGAAVLAHPQLGSVLRGTLVPQLAFNRASLVLLVAVIGTSLSPYLYVWQASQEVEEDILMGHRRLSDRGGATRAELNHTARDVGFGMFFSNLVMYFIILSTAATLYPAGVRSISTAAAAAQALRPLAGGAAAMLFALGVVGVGMLAVPVMTIGAAHMVCGALGWKHGMTVGGREARGFHVIIGVVTVTAIAANFLGFRPMHLLVTAGLVQGILAPVLLLLIMLMTNNRAIMGPWVNRTAINVVGWGTTVLVAAAALALAAAYR